MIYLMEDRDYLKIGYAQFKNIIESNYKTYNLYAKIIKTKPGIVKNKQILCELCKPYHISGEWFKNCQEVIDIFEQYNSLADIDFIKYKEFVTKQGIYICTHFLELIEGHDSLNIYGGELIWSGRMYDLERKIERIVPEINNYLNIENWLRYRKEQTKFWKYTTKGQWQNKSETFEILPGLILSARTMTFQKDGKTYIHYDWNNKEGNGD